MKRSVLATLNCAVLMAAVSTAFADDDAVNNISALSKDAAAKAFLKDGQNPVKNPGYSPYAGRNYPTRPLFGDTHLHTALSLDARAFGNTLGPAEAYRFARGEEVVSATGQPAKLARPLDFLVVADHAEALGAMVEVAKGNPLVMGDPATKRWHDMMKTGGETGVKAAIEIIQALGAGKLPKVLLDEKLNRTIWEGYTAVGDKYNEPGRFTAFLGYEWTSNNKGNNLHRVVIFRDDKPKVDQVLPFSSLDSENPADLWKFLAAYEKRTGGQVLAIAHNGNLSNGRMFGPLDFLGKPITWEYAETRARWEPLYEVTQIKGDGEAHKHLAPNDEFAGFEIWDKANLDMSELKKPEMLQYEYARQGLKIGLKYEKDLGVNPFKFGMIGSTDSHTSLATADSDNFFGKHSGVEPSAERAAHPAAKFGDMVILGSEMAASGYAAVWANENTRAAIFDAMKRRETYATTGPRMVVRFFGGWNFDTNDAKSRNLAVAGYEKGVPMGGDLNKRPPQAKAPTFLVAVLKDPIGANLDRAQVVKGWMDAKGELQEKVYDVVWSGDRRPGANGKLPLVGNTVDAATATWSNSIGSTELITTWKDPEFDPALRAFYYVRVLEIPTPRWTTYDAVRFNVKMDPKIPVTVQQRAYTSPIWYTP
jgi:hypothetical protein